MKPDFTRILEEKKLIETFEKGTLEAKLRMCEEYISKYKKNESSEQVNQYPDNDKPYRCRAYYRDVYIDRQQMVYAFDSGAYLKGVYDDLLKSYMYDDIIGDRIGGEVYRDYATDSIKIRSKLLLPLEFPKANIQTTFGKLMKGHI